MKIKHIYRGALPTVVAVLLAFGATAPAWGEGCIQGDEGSANPILFAKGKQSCDTITGYTGCSVTKGSGSCDIRDPADNSIVTTVDSVVDATGALTWTSSGPAKIFSAGLNGIQSGNACVYFYSGGEGAEQTGLGYNAGMDDANPSFSNVQEAFFCTDLREETVLAEPDIKPCSATDIDPDDTTCLISPTGAVVEVWTPTYDDNNVVNGTELTACVCDNGGTDTVNIYPCNLSGVDDGDPNTLENCFDPLKGDVEAPTTIEYFPDAKRCTTSGGTRSCDCIDNPFTTCNECTQVCS